MAELLQEARDALKRCHDALDAIYNHNAAARAAVIAHYGIHHGSVDAILARMDACRASPAAPQGAARMPLSEERAMDLIADCAMCEGPLSAREVLNFIRTVEAEHGIALADSQPASEGHNDADA